MMPSQRQSRTVVTHTPTQGGGYQRVTETTPGTQRQSTGQRISTARSYGPTNVGQKAGTIGTLEAEYLGTLILIFLTVFTDASSAYSDKMLAIMKRGTLASILFFILALFSTAGEGAAKFAKAFGLLVMAGVFLSTAGQNTISILDEFIKADWTSGGTADSPANSSANALAGQQSGVSEAQNIATIPGIPPTAAVPGDIVTGAENILNWVKTHGNIGQAAKNALERLIP